MEVNGNKAALKKYTVEHLINEIASKKIRKISHFSHHKYRF